MSLLYKLFNIPRTQEEAIDKAKRNNQTVRIETDFNIWPGYFTGNVGALDTYESSVIVRVGEKKYVKSYSLKDFMPSRESTETLRNLAEIRAKSLKRMVA
ncbi:MAG: hypothetical protein Q8L47_00700 [bacterium]|nr:hypothetical protein [bacterium]